MTKASDNLFPKIILQEAADDGSDFSNPSADYRVVFLGEDGSLHAKDSSGTVTALGGTGIAESLLDAQGDIIVASAADTAARLALGASGTVPRSNGTTLAYAFPPGHEYDYAQITSDVNVTATTEAGADTVITGASVAYDGSTIVEIEFFAPVAQLEDTAGRFMSVWLYDGASSIGQIAFLRNPAAAHMNWSVVGKTRLTPSAASHTYSVRASVSAGTGVVSAGAGGTGVNRPAYLRITKV